MPALLTVAIDRPGLSAAVLQTVRAAVAFDLMNLLAPYPPSGPWNDPSHPRWYERGFGPRWRRRDGSVGGRATSQRLGQRWSVRPTALGVTLVNNASYAPFVVGQQPVSWAAGHGWRSVGDVWDQWRASGHLDQIVRSALAHQPKGAPR